MNHPGHTILVALVPDNTDRRRLLQVLITNQTSSQAGMLGEEVTTLSPERVRRLCLRHDVVVTEEESEKIAQFMNAL